MPDNQKAVLVVEDEKPLAHALELKLSHEGFKVTLAANGQECLDFIKKQHFDVALLDLVMPVLDGFQVLEQLQTLSDVPTVFVLSNLSQHEDEERVLSLGAKKFFIKSDTPLTVIVEEVKQA
ncbi:MAG TPA: response regulator [Candidatus Saccharimonadales bacterium]|nr:response regulator [Candidatus Saccharimonadales bacterium]